MEDLTRAQTSFVAEESQDHDEMAFWAGADGVSGPAEALEIQDLPTLL